MLFDGSGAPKPESAPPAAETSQQSTSKQTPAALELDAPIRDDGFGGNLGQDIMGERGRSAAALLSCAGVVCIAKFQLAEFRDIYF